MAATNTLNSTRPKILFFTKYSQGGASSRYRTLQYIAHFEEKGMQCEVSPLFTDDYLLHRYSNGRGWLLDIVNAFVYRILALFRVRRFDLIVIEYEILPFFPAVLERLLKRLDVPYIVDYDDAIFHKYDNHRSAIIRTLLGKKVSSVMRDAEIVVVGNEYLADYARKASAKRIEVVPTVINLEKYYHSGKTFHAISTFTIGWIGSPSTSIYLQMIEHALAEVCMDGGGKVTLIGSGNVGLPTVPFDVLPWDKLTEVNIINEFDVGIMPLPDELWTKGKCGFKLIQYMACGIPVVASPIGVNRDIVDHGVNGFLASTDDEWRHALETLRANPSLRRRMGKAGRRKVEEHYCLQIMAPRLAKLLKSIVEKK